MNYRILKSVTLFFISISYCNTIAGQGFDDDLEEKLLKSVAYIEDTKVKIENINGQQYEIWIKDVNSKVSKPYTYKDLGTGFFVSTDLDYYLVTAEHVSRFMTLNSSIALSKSDGKCKEFLLKELIADTILNWTIHPISDIAVLHLDFSKLSDTININPIPFKIINSKMEAPLRVREVTVIGFPLGLGYGSDKISPITKTLKPVSDIIQLNRFDNRKIAPFFLLDDPSVGGFSGAPLLECPQEIGLLNEKRTIMIHRLVGLVHGTINDKAGGFAAIVPAMHIKETIEAAPGYSGIDTIFYPNRSIWSILYYKSGFPFTVISNNDKNGNDQDKGTLKSGNGALKIYDENSQLKEILDFKNGILVSTNYLK